MKAILLMVGTELLNGGMVDTNSLYIAEELNKYGIEIESKIVVRDFLEEIEKIINYAKKNSDLIIMSGGLGPTLDDLTKEAIANYLNKKLIVDEEEKIELIEKFKKIGVEFRGINLKEIEKPEGAISFKNDAGMAPGIFVEGIAAFPGVPSELYNLLPKFLKWYSKEFMNDIDEIYIKDIITVGIPESILEEKVKKYFTEEKIYYEFLVKDYGILIRLQTTISNKKSIEKITKNLYNDIGNNIYGEDSDRLENILINKLREKKLKISLAESCTGGMLSSKIIDVPGASDVLFESVVCYDNNSKISRLKVSEKTLEKFGAVSNKVAEEMLKGLSTEVGISITGIAGPNGGTEEKPVGLVYIGIKINDKIQIKEYRFKGNRRRIREKAVIHALFDTVKSL